jgi:inorganic pyrophosphatase
VVENLDQGLLQAYLKSANEAQERFEKELKELKENYKKLALRKTMEFYR